MKFDIQRYESGSPKYVTIVGSQNQNCNSIFGGQQQIADMDPV